MVYYQYIEGIVYAIAGLAIIVLFRKKHKSLSHLKMSDIPELPEKAFLQFKELLNTAYERLLYLGIAFLLLSYAALFGRGYNTKIVFIIFIIGLFIYNIPPRNKIMKLLDYYDIDYRELKKRSIRL